MPTGNDSKIFTEAGYKILVEVGNDLYWQPGAEGIYRLWLLH